MKLRGIDLGNVFAASGSLNFLGEGYWFHKYLKILTLGLSSFSGATFIAKTTPYDPNPGNMPLNRKLQPREWRPKCIWVDPLKKIALNSVGLTSPGAEYLFRRNVWQNLRKPFGLSFMAIKATKEERLEEARKYCALLKKELPRFKAPIFLQINVSCPNTRHSPRELIREALELLQIFSVLSIPLDLKLNIAADLKLLKEIQASGLCDVVTCSNTILFGWFPEKINWNKLFPQGSPLSDLGGGGLSGSPVFPLVIGWCRRMREGGITMPLKLSNGIIYPHQVDIVEKAGGNAIELGSIDFIRPLNIKRIINRVNLLW